MAVSSIRDSIGSLDATERQVFRHLREQNRLYWLGHPCFQPVPEDRRDYLCWRTCGGSCLLRVTIMLAIYSARTRGGSWMRGRFLQASSTSLTSAKASLLADP